MMAADQWMNTIHKGYLSDEYWMLFLPDTAKTYYGTKTALDLAIAPRKRERLGAVVLGPFTRGDVLCDWSLNIRTGLHGYLLGDLKRGQKQ